MSKNEAWSAGQYWESFFYWKVWLFVFYDWDFECTDYLYLLIQKFTKKLKILSMKISMQNHTLMDLFHLIFMSLLAK